MLTLGGRVVMVTLGLSLLLVVSKAIRAEHDCPDEIGDLAIPVRNGMDVAAKRAKIIRAKAPPELLPGAVSDATPVAAQEAIDPILDSRANSSRRRRTEERGTSKSSRRFQGDPGSTTDLPIERLRQRSNVDVEPMRPVLLADQSTLKEVMRRLADLDETCPLCGKRCEATDGDDGISCARVPSHLNVRDRRSLDDVAHDEPSKEGELTRPLQAGEPAQVILDTQRRLGKSVLDGTEFGGSPELLIQWIRALDDENRRQQALIEEVSHSDAEDFNEVQSAVNKQSQVESLRNACRQLQEAAEMLEEQNLFEAADSIRGVADNLRRQSRTMVSDLKTN